MYTCICKCIYIYIYIYVYVYITRIRGSPCFVRLTWYVMLML